MKNIRTIRVMNGIAALGIAIILILLLVSGAKAQGSLNRTQVDMLRDFGPVGVDGSVIIRGVKLAEVGDSLLLAFDVVLNARAMNNRQSWHIVPALMGGDGVAGISPSLLINGRQKARHYNRKKRFRNRWAMENQPDYKASIPRGSDTVLSYRFTTLYQPWMDDATLVLYQYLASPKEKRQLFAAMDYGRVKIQPREPYAVQPMVNYITPDKEVKRRSVSAQAFIDFPAGVSKIQPRYRRNPGELARIDRDFREIMGNKYVEMEAVYMEGYASPEGSYNLNERLSRERVEALRAYLAERVDIDPEIIKTSNVPEDWDGLRAAIESWDEGTAKERILSVIDSSDDPDSKERRLRALPQWRAILNDVFPLLRRTEYRIDFRVMDFTVEDSRSLIESSPELFSHHELYLLALSYDDPAKRLEILETILRFYPDDDTALNNYAAALIESGEYPTAKRYLERVSDPDIAANNLGVVLLLDGQYDQAQRYLTRSQAQEAAHNLQELQRKTEDDAKMERYKDR